MVDIQRNPNKYRCRFILRPNRSLSWRGSLYFFLSFCLVSGTIATGMAMLGYWLVLPFAGLEVLVVGASLYVVACRCYECEVISITEDSIEVERGRRRLRQRGTLKRTWTQVCLERRAAGWQPTRLVIRSHGRSIEVGRFLNEDERGRLAVELARSL